MIFINQAILYFNIVLPYTLVNVQFHLNYFYSFRGYLKSFFFFQNVQYVQFYIIDGMLIQKKQLTIFKFRHLILRDDNKKKDTFFVIWLTFMRYKCPN